MTGFAVPWSPAAGDVSVLFARERATEDTRDRLYSSAQSPRTARHHAGAGPGVARGTIEARSLSDGMRKMLGRGGTEARHRPHRYLTSRESVVDRVRSTNERSAIPTRHLTCVGVAGATGIRSCAWRHRNSVSIAVPVSSAFRSST